MTQKNTHNGLDSLLKIMKTLRQPGGCPWDAAQTPESLAPYILEEACELVDVIEAGNTELILDELGDLLLQVVFQAQIFRERQHFDFNDVAEAIASKLIRRHPHVFEPTNEKKSNEELNQQWEEIKRSEGSNIKSCLADHLPTKLPALQRAQKLIAKAHKTNRQQELPQNLSANSGQQEPISEEQLGNALFQLVCSAYDAGLDAESALRKMVARTVHSMDHDAV